MSWHEDETRGSKETESASLLYCTTIVSFGNNIRMAIKFS
jgi:hypothetical protein